MCEGVQMRIRDILIFSEIPIGIKERAWIAAFRRTAFKIVREGIDSRCRNVRVLRKVPFRMEEWIGVKSASCSNQHVVGNKKIDPAWTNSRSEERRVGKEV